MSETRVSTYVDYGSLYLTQRSYENQTSRENVQNAIANATVRALQNSDELFSMRKANLIDALEVRQKQTQYVCKSIGDFNSIAKLQSEYPEYSIVSSVPHDLSGHPYARESRRMESTIIFDKIIELHKNHELGHSPCGSRYDYLVKDVGASFSYHVLQGHKQVHSCCPTLGMKDLERRADTANFIYNHCVDEMVRSRVTNKMLRDPTSYCSSMSQYCRVKAPIVTFIHSAYDIKLADVSRIMTLAEAVEGWIVLHYDPIVITQEKGVLPKIDMNFEKFRTENGDVRIRFWFDRENSMHYEHSFYDYISIVNASYVYSPDKKFIYSIEVKSFVNSTIRLKLHRNTKVHLGKQLVVRTQNFGDPDTYVIDTWKYVVTETELSEDHLVPVRVHAPKRLFDLILSFTMCLSNTKFVIENVRQAAASFNTREVVAGMSVKQTDPVDNDTLYALCDAAYMCVFIRNYTSGKLLKKLTEEETELRKENNFNNVFSAGFKCVTNLFKPWKRTRGHPFARQLNPTIEFQQTVDSVHTTLQEKNVLLDNETRPRFLIWWARFFAFANSTKPRHPINVSGGARVLTVREHLASVVSESIPYHVPYLAPASLGNVITTEFVDFNDAALPTQQPDLPMTDVEYHAECTEEDLVPQAVPGDGDCGYHAFLTCIDSDMAVDELVARLGKSHFLSSLDRDGSVLQTIRARGEGQAGWVTDDVLNLMAHEFDVTVCLHLVSSSDNTSYRRFNPGRGMVVHIQHKDDHFEPLMKESHFPILGDLIDVPQDYGFDIVPFPDVKEYNDYLEPILHRRPNGTQSIDMEASLLSLTYSPRANANNFGHKTQLSLLLNDALTNVLQYTRVERARVAVFDDVEPAVLLSTTFGAAVGVITPYPDIMNKAPRDLELREFDFRSVDNSLKILSNSTTCDLVVLCPYFSSDRVFRIATEPFEEKLRASLPLISTLKVKGDCVIYMPAPLNATSAALISLMTPAFTETTLYASSLAAEHNPWVMVVAKGYKGRFACLSRLPDLVSSGVKAEHLDSFVELNSIYDSRLTKAMSQLRTDKRKGGERRPISRVDYNFVVKNLAREKKRIQGGGVESETVDLGLRDIRPFKPELRYSKDDDLETASKKFLQSVLTDVSALGHSVDFHDESICDTVKALVSSRNYNQRYMGYFILKTMRERRESGRDFVLLSKPKKMMSQVLCSTLVDMTEFLSTRMSDLRRYFSDFQAKLDEERKSREPTGDYADRNNLITIADKLIEKNSAAVREIRDQMETQVSQPPGSVSSASSTSGGLTSPQPIPPRSDRGAAEHPSPVLTDSCAEALFPVSELNDDFCLQAFKNAGRDVRSLNKVLQEYINYEQVETEAIRGCCETVQEFYTYKPVMRKIDPVDELDGKCLLYIPDPKSMPVELFKNSLKIFRERKHRVSYVWNGLSQGKFELTSDDLLSRWRFVFSYDAMKIFTNWDIYECLKDYVIERPLPYNCGVVQAVAGAGKTTSIVRKTVTLGSVTFLVLVSTVEGKRDLVRRLTEHCAETGNHFFDPEKVVKTYDSFLMHRQTSSVSVVFCDEALMQHPGKVLVCVDMLKPVVVRCYGDGLQIPFVNRSASNLTLVYDSLLRILAVVDLMRVSHRCPLDVMMTLFAMYYSFFKKLGFPLGPQSTNLKVGTMRHIRVRNLADVKAKLAGVDMVFCHYVSEVDDLRKAGIDVTGTTHQIQGTQARSVAMIRLRKSGELYNNDTYNLVAITRHTDKFVLLDMSLLDDRLVTLVNLYRTGTLNALRPKVELVRGGATSFDYFKGIPFRVQPPVPYTCDAVVSKVEISNVSFGKLFSVGTGSTHFADYSTQRTGPNKLRVLVNKNRALAQRRFEEVVRQHSDSIVGATCVFDPECVKLDSNRVKSSLYRAGALQVLVKPSCVYTVPEVFHTCTRFGLPVLPNTQVTNFFKLEVNEFNSFAFPLGDTADCVTILQSYANHAFNFSLGHTNEFDQVALELSSFRLNTENLRLDPVKGTYRMSKYDRMRPLLRTNCYRKQVTTERSAVLAITKRNANVPDLLTVCNVRLEATKSVQSFLDILVNLNLDTVVPNMGDANDWVLNQPTSIRSRLEVNSAFHEIPLNVYNFALKENPKPDVTAFSSSTYPVCQTILYQEKYVNMVFCMIWAAIRDRVIEALPKKFLIYTGLADMEFHSLMNDRMNATNLDGCRKLEFDMSKYDKSQGAMILLIECELLRRFGVSEDYITLWYNAHANTRFKSQKLGLGMDLRYQRKTGDASTFFGNTLALMIMLLDVIPFDDIQFGMFAGDDSILFTYGDPKSYRLEKLGYKFNLEHKLFEFKYQYFCSKFLVRCGEFWFLVPDPLKRLVKLGRTDLVNPAHVEEYRVSLHDNVFLYAYPGIRFVVSEAVKERYSLSLGCDRVMSVIYNLTKHPEKFSGLFYSELGDVLNYDPSRPSLEI